MKYLLDFDHTMFDTHAFVADAHSRALDDKLVTAQIWDTLKVRDYMYPDTMHWLKLQQKDSVVIVSAFTPALGPDAEAMQRGKFSQGDFDDLVSEIVVMEGDKAPHVCPFTTTDEVIFIDDRLDHLESVKAACPEAHCIQMWRGASQTESVDGKSSRDDIPVVHDFTEIDSVVASLVASV